MKSLAVGEFKTHFSEVLNDVKQPVALGVMEETATYRIREGFELTDEDLLES